MKTPEVLHGKPRIDGTRVGVLQIAELVREDGWSVEAVTEQFDVDAKQVEAALAYYDGHPELMETLRAQRAASRAEIRDRSRRES